MLSQNQIALIKATAPVVGAHARDITECFYPLMFERYPRVKALFNQAHQQQGTQRQALANALVAYATHIDKLEALGDAVGLIAHKHCSLNIRPEDYPIVGECLMEAIGKVLGDAVTPEIADAWSAAYQQLADILINVEREIYQHNAQRQGGWEGERAFTMVEKKQESQVITTFRFAPADGDQNPIDFVPGQYIGLILQANGQSLRRNYSLSAAPGAPTLSISVKREPQGVASNHLHDHVQVGDVVHLTAPCGDFVLNQSQRPLVLISGGVGITPTLPMLDVAVTQGRDVAFVHAANHSGNHAFKGKVDALAAAHANLRCFYIYDQPLAGDKPHATGFIQRDHLAGLLPPDRNADVYFLGPKPFMRQVNQLLQELGVPQSQVHYEFFGPLDSLEAA